MGGVRKISRLVAFTLPAALAGGCQPKQVGDPAVAASSSTRPAIATAARPDSREPLRRVEVISQQSARVAGSMLGRKCRVQLRRDALGMAGNMPTQLTGRWANEATVEGSVLELTDQWLIVQASDRRVVIPHASILLIELQD
jgi:hypothetical protein